MSYARTYLSQTIEIASALLELSPQLDELADQLCNLRERSARIYVIGLGGSAANAMHMSADLRNLCQMDAISLDSLAEITARANDSGLETIFDGMLDCICHWDAIFVLSVGGGTPHVSTAIARAVKKAKAAEAKIFGIVGPNGGITAEYGDCVIKIPAAINPTPHTEAFQAVLWHYLCSHPALQKVSTKWR